MPTAVQALLDVHDTPPLRTLAVAPAGLGVLWIVQLLPFQTSASVTGMPPSSVSYPTAVHAVLAVHDTSLKKSSWAPFGFGVLWTAHPVPFHRSARVTSFPALFRYCPTAAQALLEAHDTPLK